MNKKIYAKLEPHAQRINAGEGNDFDYLPAVLLHLIEVQKEQAKLLNASVTALDAYKSTTEIFGADVKEGIAGLRKSQLTITEQIKALDNILQQAHQKLTRLLLVGLVVSIGTIGLVITIFQRH